jgi:TolB-like protein
MSRHNILLYVYLFLLLESRPAVRIRATFNFVLLGRFSVDTRPPTPPSPLSPADRLDSWKSIALHLKKDVRTVQRWELEGLPVYRHRHSKHGSIYAYRSEIDSWWTSRQAAPSKQKQTESKRNLKPASEVRARYLRLAVYAALGFAIALSGLVLARFLLRREQAGVVHSTVAKPVAIAVLPFEDLSSNSENSNLAENLTIALIKDLQRSNSIRVLNAQPVAHGARNLDNLQHIVKVLHADEAVEGSIRREGDRIRVTAQLVDSATGSVVWTAQFERDSADATHVQDRVAHAIAVGIENASP